MKTKDEMITDLLEVVDNITETVEENAIIEADFMLIQPIIEQLRDELVALTEIE